MFTRNPRVESRVELLYEQQLRISDAHKNLKAGGGGGKHTTFRFSFTDFLQGLERT